MMHSSIPSALVFNLDSIAELNADIPAFDSFDPDMSSRDRRDCEQTWGGTLAWARLDGIAYLTTIGRWDLAPWALECDRAIRNLERASESI